MKKLILTFSILLLFNGCGNRETDNTANSSGLDSLSIIYTKDKHSIVRPTWLDQRHFAITGQLMNTAKYNSYKDFLVEVYYTSQTGTLLDTKKYTIYTSIAPNKLIDFDEEIKDIAPEGASFHETTWKLLSATAYIENNK